MGKQVELAAIDAAAIRAQVENDPKLSTHIMSVLSERNAQTQLKLEHINTMSAAQRLGCFLLRLCAAQSNGTKLLHIPVEKNVLAAYLGMKPETLSRSQQQLKPLGVQIAGERVEIAKIDQLREFVCGSCSESGMGNCEGEN
jgi:CRP-like cAMP-binding protein